MKMTNMTELHICKYCGVETTQPDDECYAKPTKDITVVQWLKSKLPSLFQDDSGHYENIFNQALEMEKQQIIDAFDEGNPNGFIIKDGEQYYNETYKKDKP